MNKDFLSQLVWFTNVFDNDAVESIGESPTVW